MTHPNTKLKDVSLKQAYEWVKTGKWTCSMFYMWLHTKGIAPDRPLYTAGGTLIHRPSCQLAYEWVKSGHWNRRLLTNWMNSFL